MTMRIVQLSTYDLYGGAGLAAVRLHSALRAAGEIFCSAQFAGATVIAAGTVNNGHTNQPNV